MSGDEIIQAITDEIVAIANPIEIILFGSRARHTASPNSDFDFCIIISDEMRSKCVGLIQNVIYNEGIKTYAQPAA